MATIQGYAELDELPDESLEPGDERDAGHPPTRDENPLSAWSWRCSIAGRAGGPLAGRTVAIKDNTAVAGLPLRLGTTVMGDFV